MPTDLSKIGVCEEQLPPADQCCSILTVSFISNLLVACHLLVTCRSTLDRLLAHLEKDNRHAKESWWELFFTSNHKSANSSDSNQKIALPKQSLYFLIRLWPNKNCGEFNKCECKRMGACWRTFHSPLSDSVLNCFAHMLALLSLRKEKGSKQTEQWIQALSNHLAPKAISYPSYFLDTDTCVSFTCSKSIASQR